MIPAELEARILELGHIKAAARAKAFLLEKELKSTYGEAYARIRDIDGKTQGDAQQMAYAAKDYREAVKRAHDALHESEVARVNYDALYARFEAWRSLNASQREQIKQGVYQ